MDMSTIWGKFAGYLQTVLPTSPFRQFISAMPTSIGFKWLNWLVPVHDILAVLAAWLAAVTLFYLYSIIMRWLKVIGD